MKNFMKSIYSRAEDIGLTYDDKRIAIIFTTIEAWAWGLELTKKEERDFWNAKNSLGFVTMSEICKEVINLKRSIDKKTNEKQKN